MTFRKLLNRVQAIGRRSGRPAILATWDAHTYELRKLVATPTEMEEIKARIREERLADAEKLIIEKCQSLSYEMLAVAECIEAGGYMTSSDEKAAIKKAITRLLKAIRKAEAQAKYFEMAEEKARAKAKNKEADLQKILANMPSCRRSRL